MIEIIYALLLTILIEGFVLILIKEKSLIKYSILINIVTNVTLNIILNFIKIKNIILYLIILLIMELIITIVEALIYNLIIKNKTKSLKISFILNCTSFIIGTIILNIFLK